MHGYETTLHLEDLVRYRSVAMIGWADGHYAATEILVLLLPGLTGALGFATASAAAKDRCASPESADNLAI